MKRILCHPIARKLPATAILLSLLIAGCSEESPETPGDVSCGTPQGLTATAVSSTSATFNWTAVSGATGYRIRYKTAASSTWTSTTSGGNSRAISGLVAGTQYNFQVQTVCSADSSAYSAIASFTTATVSACGEGTISFAAQVAPVIAASCAQPSCHNAGSTKGPGALTNYNQVFNARNDIRREVFNGSMPPGGLSQADKQTIICWIDNGAPNN